MSSHPDLDVALAAASLTMELGGVERATEHPDGRRETDTTHTVMLAIVAVELAARHPELGLDLGLVSQLAVVHDLVEAYVGDVDTGGGLTIEARAAKEAREAWALEQLRQGPLARSASLVARYEAQAEAEARWVRYLDKLLPRLTATLNGGAAVARRGRTPDRHRELCVTQEEELAARYPELAHVAGRLLAAAREASTLAMLTGR